MKAGGRYNEWANFLDLGDTMNPTSIELTGTLQPDGTLDATYEWAGGISRAILTRVLD